MRRLRAVLVGSAVVCSVSASAAEVTRVVTSFEEKDPLGLVMSVGFERTLTRSAIFREAPPVAPGEVPPNVLKPGYTTPLPGYVPELFYSGIDARMNMDLRLGISPDVELRFGLPLVFAKDESWRLSGALENPEQSSTVLNNCVGADGGLSDPSCPTTGAQAAPLFGTPDSWAAYRGGLGNLRFGITYGVLNQQRDWTKPNWVLSFDYEAPTAQMLDPTIATAATERGTFGDRNHRYTFSTALSRRFGVADPYFKASYTLPYRGPGWYSNCDHADSSSMARPQNCGSDAWSRSETGIQAPQTGSIMFGTELNLGEDTAKQSRFALDLSGHLNYVGPGRYYNPLSGLLHKLLRTEDYVQMGGSLGLVAIPADFFRLTASARVSYVTDHGLTAEDVGRDLNGNGTVDLDSAIEANPNFDYRVDAPTRRFRAVDMTTFELRAAVEFNF
ncbi:MAG: hypothetical protein L0Y66_02970 [Myxococcaceae bacterium]|nr:hypothetical protein [Myxococcaceae bacterium]MCI0670697.1 hypothetical protein [Myxococcaceae bacterium]